MLAMAAGGSSAVSSLRAQNPQPGKPFGSGHFGEWIEDGFGLPAFRYTCQQMNDPKAATAVSPGILSATEHIHQIGNDRLVAMASNYGHVRVRQDEGAPKFLNDHSPERSQFGGGIGYLTDGHETLSTYYSGGAGSFERVFGMGYFRKTVTGSKYTVDQVIVAPFGDDPVLLSRVTIANRGDAPAQLRWIEYWGCQVYQFSFRCFMEGFAGGGPVEARRRLGDRFAHDFDRLPDAAGLIEKKRFLGRLPEDERTWERVQAALVKQGNPFLAPVGPQADGASFDDLQPRPTFLASLDAQADGFTTDAKGFFGAGGVTSPSGLAAELNGDAAAKAAGAGLLLERRIELQPGEHRTLSFLYGYLPDGMEAAPLLAKYRASAPQVWSESSRAWKKSALSFRTPAVPWVEREMAWHYYYLRSALTYDDFFGEHILSQGSIYQYVMGFQGAARDPLQHALPFLFSDPWIVKETLRYTLKEVRADGSVPYGIVGHGVVMPTVNDNSSDMPLWLLWAASEYVLATRDRAFLDEEIPARLVANGEGKATARSLLARCYWHLIEDVATGEHALMRMLQDDWNDALVIFWAQGFAGAPKAVLEKGESVLNSAMAAYVFDRYASLLEYTGEDGGMAAQVRQKAEEHRKAVRAQWTGEWFRRAWLGEAKGWLGDSTLWIEPQPWALIAGVADAGQTRELVKNLDEMLRHPSPIGAVQMGPGPDLLQRGAVEPGTSVNGGVWPSLNQTLVWALAGIDAQMAWDEWLKNTLARHAEAYPDIWYATWSGPDTLNAASSKHPGETVNNAFLHYTDFPVACLHSHACVLYAAPRLHGLEFTGAGLDLAPSLPLETYAFESPLFGISKTAHGYQGWYAPQAAGTWTIRLKLAEAERRGISKATVNGARVKLTEGVIELKGKSTPGKPLRWSVEKS